MIRSTYSSSRQGGSHSSPSLLLILVLSAFIVAAGCSTGTGDSTEAAGDGASSVQVVSLTDLESDLKPRLSSQFGPANLACGTSDFFMPGVYQGDLQRDDGLQCIYMESEKMYEQRRAKDPKAGPLLVQVTVLFTSADSYSYSARKTPSFKESKGADPIQPEWMYRDGLTCGQLAAAPTRETLPGPDFTRGMPEGMELSSGKDGLTYPSVVYYWFDTDQPDSMDADGDGRPCTEQYPAEDVRAVFEETLPLQMRDAGRTGIDGGLTAFQIRTNLAEDFLTDGASQIDCSLAGPVTVGSTMTCAPRVNGPPDSRLVAVVDNDGGFLVSPSVEESRATKAATVFSYRPGLSCKQIAAPVTTETLAEGVKMSDLSDASAKKGLTYLDAVFYNYLHGTAGEPDESGAAWPCTDAYPADEVAQVQDQVRRVG